MRVDRRLVVIHDDRHQVLLGSMRTVPLPSDCRRTPSGVASLFVAHDEVLGIDVAVGSSEVAALRNAARAAPAATA